MTTIAVIGAQGRFGTRLCERLAKMMPDASILATKNKESTSDLASRADMVALTVRTDQAEETLRVISKVLNSNAVVVSFAGRYPLAQISTITKRTALRVMVDPFWNMCAYVRSGNIGEVMNELLARLTTTEPLELHSDHELDRYTNLLAHLFAVLLLQRLGRIQNAHEHLEFLTKEFSKFGRAFTRREFEQCDLGNDPEESLRAIATPGGITEKALVLLSAGIGPSEIQQTLVNL